MGECYFYGHGVSHDSSTGIRWYWKAAKQGHSGAKFMLGVCYKNGNGVIKDIDMARKLLTESAEQGHEEAKKQLNEMKWWEKFL